GSIAVPPHHGVMGSHFTGFLDQSNYPQPTGTRPVEGKTTYVFDLPEGRQVKGYDLQKPGDWPWRHSVQVPGVRYARLRATSPTYGAVTIIIVDEPREEQFYVMCLDTAISGPRLIRAWKRRHWIEHCFRTLKHLLATGACQVHSEEAYYGHLVLRLMGCFVLFYTSRVICKGRLTMEEIIFSLKHYWRFVDSEPLELKALSQVVDEEAARIQAKRIDRKSQYRAFGRRFDSLLSKVTDSSGTFP